MFTEKIIKRVEDFLQSKKSIDGNIIWNKSDEKNVHIARFPLTHNGDLIIDFNFAGTANSSGQRQSRGGTLKILYSPDDSKEKIIVCRIHVFPGNRHTNPRIKRCDVSGLCFEPYKTRFYSWDDMKLLADSSISNEKHIARYIDGVDTFEESMKYFLNYANISGTIVLPEYEIKLL